MCIQRCLGKYDSHSSHFQICLFIQRSIVLGPKIILKLIVKVTYFQVVFTKKIVCYIHFKERPISLKKWSLTNIPCRRFLIFYFVVWLVVWNTEFWSIFKHCVSYSSKVPTFNKFLTLNIFHTSPYIFSLLISTNKSKRYCVEPEFDYRCSHYEFISDTTWSSLDRRSEDSINYFGLPDHRFEEAFFTTNPKGQRRLTRPLLLHVSALAHIFEFC